ncbi:MAG: NAD-dependent epimerase/dehydratase family protein [Candidatus Micrarchaeia archaeon]
MEKKEKAKPKGAAKKKEDIKEDPEDEIGDRKIDLVTGANGKLGKELVKALLKKGDVVRALVRTKENIIELPTGVIPFLGDISKQNVLDDACKDVDIVFHLAAVASEYKFTTEEIMKTNVEGTRNVLDAAEKGGAKQIIFSSTIDVYGRKRDDLLYEKSELKPSDKYGYSKMLAESIIKEYSESLPYTILRLATIYGPGFERSYFKIFKALQEKKIYLVGNGQNHLALIHIYDALQGIMLARLNETSKNNIYNLTDGNSYTQKQLFNLAAELLNVPKPEKHANELIVKIIAKSRGLDTDELRFITSNRVVDISKIKEELGFKPMVDIKIGTAELVKLYLSKSSVKSYKI